MANIYLRSTDGDDASDGSTWALAKATLTGALAIATNADIIWVSQAHDESQAAANTTLTFPTTPGLRVLCGDDAAEPPTALALTGSVSLGAANFSINFASGFAYIYGLIFNGGTNNNGLCDIQICSATVAAGLVFDSCAFNIRSINSAAEILIGLLGGNVTDDALVRFINSTFKFGATGQSVNLRGAFIEIEGLTLDLAGSIPTTLFECVGASPGITRLEACDLSALAFTNLINVSAATPYLLTLRNTKLPASITVTTGTHPGPGSARVKMHNCDSVDTNYRFEEHSYEGSIVQETTIVRTGGASDGTTPISWKMVSSAGSTFWHPLVSPEIAIWNDTTGASKTATIEIVNDGTTFQDDEIWLEIEYLGTAGFPKGSKISDRITNILSTPANQTTSTAAWTTTGLTTPVKQKLEVTFTPQEKGYFIARVKLAEPSKTVYVDPLIVIT